MTIRKIHFVWEGDAIPEKYAANILALLAVAEPDVVVTVWTTRPMSIAATLTAMQDGLGTSAYSAAHHYLVHAFAKYLKIGDTRSVYAQLVAYLPEPGLAVRVAAMFEREISGPYRNYAAASDWTRIVVLLVEGGTYADVDVIVNVPSLFLLEPEQPDFLLWDPKRNGGMPNGLLAARQGSPHAKRLLQNMLAAVAALDTQAAAKPGHLCPPSWGSKRSNLIGPFGDARRSVHALSEYNPLGRLQGTMRTSGPLVLFNLALHDRPAHLFPAEASIFHRTIRHVNQCHFDPHAAPPTVMKTLFPEGVSIGFDGRADWLDTPRRRRASTPSLKPPSPAPGSCG